MSIAGVGTRGKLALMLCDRRYYEDRSLRERLSPSERTKFFARVDRLVSLTWQACFPSECPATMVLLSLNATDCSLSSRHPEQVPEIVDLLIQEI